MKKLIIFLFLLTLIACSSDATKKSETDSAEKTETDAVEKTETLPVQENEENAVMNIEVEPAVKIDILELDFPDIVGVKKRAEWGWVPINTEVNYHKIEKITLHHGGVEYKEGKDPVKYLQNLQSWSRSDKKWVDIPYHYMIDLDGVIYECRPINIPGDTNTEYDPTTHALICVMGNYEVQTLNEKQLQAIIKMCVYLVQRFDVPSNEIKSHKDYSEITACPGEDIYKYLKDGTIISRVNKILNQE